MRFRSPWTCFKVSKLKFVVKAQYPHAVGWWTTSVGGQDGLIVLPSTFWQLQPRKQREMVWVANISPLNDPNSIGNVRRKTCLLVQAKKTSIAWLHTSVPKICNRKYKQDNPCRPTFFFFVFLVETMLQNFSFYSLYFSCKLQTLISYIRSNNVARSKYNFPLVAWNELSEHRPVDETGKDSSSALLKLWDLQLKENPHGPGIHKHHIAIHDSMDGKCEYFIPRLPIVYTPDAAVGILVVAICSPWRHCNTFLGFI